MIIKHAVVLPEWAISQTQDISRITLSWKVENGRNWLRILSMADFGFVGIGPSTS
jgi:hypothetical protein